MKMKKKTMPRVAGKKIRRVYGDQSNRNPLCDWMERNKLDMQIAPIYLNCAEFNLRNWVAGRARPSAEQLAAILRGRFGMLLGKPGDRIDLVLAILRYYYTEPRSSTRA